MKANDNIYKTIVSNIIEYEIRTQVREVTGTYSLLVKMDLSLEPRRSEFTEYIEFEALFAIKGKHYNVDGLIDHHGRITLGDLTCDGKLIYKFY